MDFNADKRKEAIEALRNLAIFEAFFLIAVTGVYLYTSSMTYLVGGLVGTVAIFAPLWLRWVREHAKALQQNPNTDEEENR